MDPRSARMVASAGVFSRSAETLRIDQAAECIWRGGEKVGVPPKAFLVLRRLMDRPGQLVTKKELLEAVWPNTYITEGVLNNAVLQVRQALGDDPKHPRFIETVHRRGYRWIGSSFAKASEDRPSFAEASAAEASAEGGEHLVGAELSGEFVGRADSLAVLARCYDRAAAGQRQLVLIGGEPGIGKTALVDRFLDAIQGSLGRGQCIETYGPGDLYRPWREVVEQLMRNGSTEIQAIFRRHAPSWLLSMPELSSPAELEALRRCVLASTGESVQRELERGLEAASATSPIVVVLEDLHWSEPATITLLWALAVRREPARLMIIATYRSADAIAQQHPIIRLRRELSTKRQCVALDLEGLPAATIRAFLDRQFPSHQMPPAFVDSLHAQTTGNPLFLLNALADLQLRGLLRQDDGVWRCTVDPDAIAATVPESTRELIALRFEQLAPATREMLEAASLCGASFVTQTVAAAIERSCGEVESALEPLARAALFLKRGDEVEWPDGTRGCRHELRHALYRQVLARGITPTRRQQLHRRIAAALEAGYGERAADVAAALSFHHEHAGDAVRAVDYIETLVQQAYARAAAYEAEELLAHAVELLKRSQTKAPPERLLRATIAHGLALNATRGVTSAESLRVLEEARALAQTMPRSLEQIAAMGTMVAGNLVRGQLREGRTLAEEMLALVGADDSPAAHVAAYSAAGGSLLYLGEVDAALGHLKRAVSHIDVATSSATESLMPGFAPQVLAYVNLALASVVSGRLEPRGAPPSLRPCRPRARSRCPGISGWR